MRGAILKVSSGGTSDSSYETGYSSMLWHACCNSAHESKLQTAHISGLFPGPCSFRHCIIRSSALLVVLDNANEWLVQMGNINSVTIRRKYSYAQLEDWLA